MLNSVFEASKWVWTKTLFLKALFPPSRQEPRSPEEPSVMDICPKATCFYVWKSFRKEPLPLRPRILVKKIGRFSKNAKMDLLKRSSPYFSRVFCPKDGFSKSIFAFYLNDRLFFTKILGLKGKGS